MITQLAFLFISQLTPPAIIEPKDGKIFDNSNTSITISWLAVPTISQFLIRASDLTDASYNTDASKNDPRNTSKGIHYLYIDQYGATSVSLPVQKNHNYRFWIHSSLPNFSYNDPTSWSQTSTGVAFSLGDTYPYSVQIAWDPSTSPEVTGYNVYTNKNSAGWTLAQTLPNVTMTKMKVVPGLYYTIAVTATAPNELESVHSNEVSFFKAPVLKINPRDKSITADLYVRGQYMMQGSTDLKSWADMAAVAASSNLDFPETELGQMFWQFDTLSAEKFFRLKVLAPPTQPQKFTAESIRVVPPGQLRLTLRDKLKLFLKYKPGHHVDEQHGGQRLKEMK